ncbi:MAG TPA: hypothetical protein ENN09_01210 [Planctomycetes bacterium]|nr:hypothetical protein [Planctomycetota bacterium]
MPETKAVTALAIAAACAALCMCLSWRTSPHTSDFRLQRRELTADALVLAHGITASRAQRVAVLARVYGSVAAALAAFLDPHELHALGRMVSGDPPP